MTTGEKSTRHSVAVRLKASESGGRSSRAKKVLSFSWLVYYYKEILHKIKYL